MASITIRNLDEPLKRRLRIRAAEHGRSMEEEVREILRATLNSPQVDSQRLGSAINALFKPVGGLDLELPPREPLRPPPSFD